MNSRYNLNTEFRKEGRKQAGIFWAVIAALIALTGMIEAGHWVMRGNHWMIIIPFAVLGLVVALVVIANRMTGGRDA